MMERASIALWRMVVRARVTRTKLIGHMMEREFRHSRICGLTKAENVEEFFGFAARDVDCVHRYQKGVGAGLFFRLYDGRVFDAAVTLQRPYRSLYDPTIH